MASGICEFCNKEIEKYLNYCSWNCHVFYAQSRGGNIHCPNNLPITCIMWDNRMLECEHGDHNDYKFPIEVEYKGEIPEDLPEWDCSYENQIHALIYTDGSIALTLGEATYNLWFVNDGWGKIEKDWKLTDESIKRIKEYLSNKNI